MPKITEREKDALISVRDGLRSRKFVHRDPYDERPSKKPVFNMGTVGLFQSRDCGSIGCIGGWVNQELRRHNSDFDFLKAPALCYPIEVKDWERITPGQAAKAIDNFLKDGNPRWKSVTRRSQRI